MKWKKILVLLAVILAGFIAAVFILLFSYDYNKFKPYIAQAVKDATGRSLTLGGDLKLKISFTPALVLENISFQNAPWGSRPEMVKVKRFELEVALLPLLRRNIQINRFRLVEPDILLEINRNGVSNLAFEKKMEAKPPEKKKDEKIALPVFLVRELLIEKGGLTYRDDRSGKSHSLALESFSMTMDSDKPVAIKAKAVYNKTPLDMAAEIGSIEALTNPSRDWPVKFQLNAEETSLSLEGVIRDAVSARGFKFNLGLKSKDIARLSSLAGTQIPVKGPLEIAGQITDPAPQIYRISGLKMMLDKSDLQGAAEINLKGPRPYLNGDFSSRLLDLRSLTPREGGAQAKTEKPAKKAEKVFSHDLLPIDSLKAVDADLKVIAEKILVPHLILEKLRVEAHLEAGSLILKPMQGIIGGGSLDGFVKLRAEGNEADLASALKIDRFDVGTLLKEFGVTDLFEGKVDMILDLQGKGNSVASLMAGLSGKTQTIMNKGRVDQKYVDRLGAGVSTNLLRILNPVKQQVKAVEINCFVNFFDIKNGLAKSTALALDTNYLTVVGEGTVNLKTEELNFSLKPVTKDTLGSKGGLDLGLSELSQPLRLGGTLAKPALDVSTAGTALTLGQMAGGGLAGLASSLAGGKAKGEQDFCRQAIESARSGKEPAQRKEKGTVEKAKEGVKGATDQAMDTFKKVFGK